MRISDWSSDVCSSDLGDGPSTVAAGGVAGGGALRTAARPGSRRSAAAAHVAAGLGRKHPSVPVHFGQLELAVCAFGGLGFAGETHNTILEQIHWVAAKRNAEVRVGLHGREKDRKSNR